MWKKGAKGRRYVQFGCEVSKADGKGEAIERCWIINTLNSLCFLLKKHSPPPFNFKSNTGVTKYILIIKTNSNDTAIRDCRK